MSEPTHPTHPPMPTPTTRSLVLAALALVVIGTSLVASGAIPRTEREQALQDEAKATASLPPRVQVVRAQSVAASDPLVLPGTVQPLQETTVFAHANGYVRQWYVDVGASVKKGQVLAELDLPDVDEELRQAQAAEHQSVAAIAQAKSQLELARSNNARFGALVRSGVVSQQQNEQYSSEYDVQRANVEAAQAASASANANVRRVTELRRYGRLVAPFDGVITMRAAEVGQLVVSGTSQGQALFRVADDAVVRVFVSVPQAYAGRIKVGMPAPVTTQEAAGRVFPGKVGRVSREFDTSTRAQLVEVDIPNPDGALVSGMYAKASFDISRQGASVVVPATSVVIDASGTHVAQVKEGVVHWQKVSIGGDLGDRLAIADGLTSGAVMALNPSRRLLEGEQVLAQGDTVASAASAPTAGRQVVARSTP
jgi:membrane fusion protein, multidrug efflux system